MENFRFFTGSWLGGLWLGASSGTAFVAGHYPSHVFIALGGLTTAYVLFILAFSAFFAMISVQNLINVLTALFGFACWPIQLFELPWRFVFLFVFPTCGDDQLSRDGTDMAMSLAAVARRAERGFGIFIAARWMWARAPFAATVLRQFEGVVGKPGGKLRRQGEFFSSPASRKRLLLAARRTLFNRGTVSRISSNGHSNRLMPCGAGMPSSR